MTVADQGPGIPATDRDGVFEMFSRNDAGGRAGLGLAIAKAFVEAHGEHIWLEDSLPGGACLLVRPSPAAHRLVRVEMTRLLVIDDDRALLRALKVGLTSHGYDVITAADGTNGITLTATEEPDVVLLDLGLPDIDGLDVCSRIRQWTDVPVIVLSAAGSEQRKVAALDGGADDYVTKPFGMAELEARIRTALRHRSTPVEQKEPLELRDGEIHMDLVHHEARVCGKLVELTSKEFDLLAFLVRHAGRLCTHKMILENVWGAGYGSESQYLRVYVYSFRHKLGNEVGGLLRTSPGVGYTFGEAPDRLRIRLPGALIANAGIGKMCASASVAAMAPRICRSRRSD